MKQNGGQVRPAGVVAIHLHKVVDRQSFHEVFAATLGFPDWYGRNMDAWIDCMTNLDAPETGLSTIHVLPGDVLTLELKGTKEFRSRCPELYATFIECAAFVNWRRIVKGHPPVLALAFYS